MNKKIIIWIMTVILLVSFVQAVDNNEALGYIEGLWKLQNSSLRLDSSNNIPTRNLTVSAVYNVTGFIGGGQRSGGGGYYETNDNAFDRLQNSQDFSVSAWIKPDSLTETGSPLCSFNTGVANTRWSLYFDPNANGDGSVGIYWCNGWSTYMGVNAVDWNLHTITWNEATNNVSWYVNDTMIWSSTSRTCGADAIDELSGFNSCGAHQQDYDGAIDEIVYWNSTLNQSYVDWLWNSGAGQNITATPISAATNLSITAIETYWGNSISNFSATINGTTYNTTNGQINTTISPTNEMLWNISLTSVGYLPITYINYNVSNSGDLSANLTRNHTSINITAYDWWDNQIFNFSIVANSLNSSSSTSGNTTNGVVSLNLNWNETYNITIDADGYALFNNTIFKDADTHFFIANFTKLYTTNSISFIFKDEVTKNLVYNVSFELISDVFANNYTTNPNASKYLDLLSPSDYVIRYSANGYPQRFYYFTLTNRSYNNLTLYLINGTYSNITATVYDEVGNTVESARIQVLKYSTSTNAYELVEQAETNWEGQTRLHLFKNVEYYKFNVLYNEEIKLQTEPTYIYSDSVNFRITLSSPPLETFYSVSGITYSLVYNNATRNFRFNWLDSDATATQACLNVSKIYGNYTINNFNSSCVSGASGTILVGIDAQNDTTYSAVAYVETGSNWRFLTSLLVKFGIDDKIGLLGIFLTTLFAITVGFAGFSLGRADIAIALIPLPYLLMSIPAWIPIHWGIWIAIQIFFLIIAIGVGSRQ